MSWLLNTIVAAEGFNASWCARLYEEQAANLLLYGRSLGLGLSEAEDVLQEVFEALLKLPSVPEQPAHYAVRAVRNRALNYRRSLLRRWWRELESHRWFEESEPENPEERRAMAELSTLPPEQREVIVLKIWQRHTFEEIGDLLGISPNTAAGRYRYGLQKLRLRCEEAEHERLESPGSNGAAAGYLAAAPPIARA